MERRNKKTKSVGNGEGSLYYSDKLERWIFQYYSNNTRKTIKQKKNEKVKDFKFRVTKIKNDLATGNYIEKKETTLKDIIAEHIQQKFNDGITGENSLKRDTETLSQIERCCSNFINLPVQKITLKHIQAAKEKMKIYRKSGIDRMWRLLFKGFRIASSPSVRLIPYNIMDDENLKKPISNIAPEKVLPLTKEEEERLIAILDNEERNHKYRNIVKLQLLTGMRLGEVLARSIYNIDNKNKTLLINNTLTEDKEGNVILGKHTKTYNKSTGIDSGIRKFPITKEINKILKEQIKNQVTNIYGLLFWDYDSNTFITVKEVNAWLKRLNKKYKIANKLHSHMLRHTTLTRWKESGMDMTAIQYLAGHVEGSKITSDVYINVSEEYIFNEFQKII